MVQRPKSYTRLRTKENIFLHVAWSLVMETTELCNQLLQAVIPGYRQCFHQVSTFCTRGLRGIMGTSQAQMVVVDVHNKIDNPGIGTTIQCKALWIRGVHGCLTFK